MKFSELAIGDEFKLNNILYKKTEPKKISCCKTLNALKIENNEKVMIKANDTVEKVTSAQ